MINDYQFIYFIYFIHEFILYVPIYVLRKSVLLSKCCKTIILAQMYNQSIVCILIVKVIFFLKQYYYP